MFSLKKIGSNVQYSFNRLFVEKEDVALNTLFFGEDTRNLIFNEIESILSETDNYVYVFTLESSCSEYARFVSSNNFLVFPHSHVSTPSVLDALLESPLTRPHIWVYFDHADAMFSPAWEDMYKIIRRCRTCNMTSFVKVDDFGSIASFKEPFLMSIWRNSAYVLADYIPEFYADAFKLSLGAENDAVFTEYISRFFKRQSDYLLVCNMIRQNYSVVRFR